MKAGSELDSLLNSMCQSSDVASRDLTTDHGRWQLYMEAMRHPECVPLLTRAVHAETDPSLASALAVQLLEIVPDAEREDVVSNLPAGQQAFSLRRMTELRSLERIVSGSMEIDEFRRGLPDWSTWLQRRTAEQADGQDYLAMLARGGQTKRVRTLAAARVQKVQAAKTPDQTLNGVPGSAENPA